MTESLVAVSVRAEDGNASAGSSDSSALPGNAAKRRAWNSSLALAMDYAILGRAV